MQSPALINSFFVSQGKQCMLQMEETKDLDHILGKWMTPSDLQKAMRRAGINIFVNEYSDKYVSINSKVTKGLNCLEANSIINC